MVTNMSAYDEQSITLEPKVRVGSIKNPNDAIGLQVYKGSKKPFKSKNVYNTVKTVTINPHTKLTAFMFEV
jgi:hypothetical protein